MPASSREPDNVCDSGFPLTIPLSPWWKEKLVSPANPGSVFLLLHTPRHERLVNLGITEVFTNTSVITHTKITQCCNKSQKQRHCLHLKFVITGSELFLFPLPCLVDNFEKNLPLPPPQFLEMFCR